MGNEKQGGQKRRTQAKLKDACLKQGIEMNRFCLKKGQGLKASAAHPHPDFPQIPPPRE